MLRNVFKQAMNTLIRIVDVEYQAFLWIGSEQSTSDSIFNNYSLVQLPYIQIFLYSQVYWLNSKNFCLQMVQGKSISCVLYTFLNYF